jgi:putative aldouronate transport system permease protein
LGRINRRLGKGIGMNTGYLTKRDKLFGILNTVFLAFVILVMTYPFIYVLSMSFSDSDQLLVDGSVVLLPRGFSVAAYKVLIDNSDIFTYYLNSIVYAAGSTVFVLLISSLTGYALSVTTFFARKVIMVLMTITMFIGGGLVPYYILIKNLGMVNTIWVMMVPSAINVWNCILFKSFFQQIPPSMRESAFIDGANDFVILFKIILPLSKAMLATFAVFALVGSWNDWFTALLFLHKEKMYPVQMLLRKMLVNLDLNNINTRALKMIVKDTRTVRCAAIVITVAPIVCVYPFFQKYFTKGIMIGAIKG